jgi:hypothetical protein
MMFFLHSLGYLFFLAEGILICYCDDELAILILSLDLPNHAQLGWFGSSSLLDHPLQVLLHRDFGLLKMNIFQSQAQKKMLVCFSE